VIEITTTVPSAQVGESLASGIIEGRMGACVQISGPVTSVYRWQGNIETSQEWRLIVKTIESRRDQVVDYLHRNHPYELPEIVEHSVEWVEPRFLAWVMQDSADS
jgi:periplasmic divalent cation tolerance protein